MINTYTRSLFGLLIVIASVLMQSPSHAKDISAVEQVSVDTPYVYLSDIFPDVDDAHKDVQAMRTPEVGQKVTLTPSWLMATAKNFGYTLQFYSYQGSTTVERASDVLGHKDLLPLIQSWLTDNEKIGDVVASIENNQTEIPVARSARGKINVSSMDVDTRNNRFVADVVIPRDQGRNQTVKVSGRYVAMMKVPTVNRQMLNGDIITSADINYVSMRADTINSQYLTTVEKIIGMTPKKSIAPDSAIRISDLQVPLLVKRNDNVNVTLSSGSMKISMKGRALENGSMGSTIKVINTASKREIEATVVGFQEVVVESMTPAHQSIAQGVNNVSTN